MTVFLGLTGSIGMGKSTTADMFLNLGVPVHDADATVHALYSGKAVPLVEAAFPGTTKDGVVDRTVLSQRVLGNDEAMKKLESLIHPLVRDAENKFRKTCEREGKRLAVLDNPLLLEMGQASRVDGIIVVTAPREIQKDRVLARPGMTVEKFEAILARQVPDADKRKQADFLIDTSRGLEAAEKDVKNIIVAVESGNWKKAHA